MFLAKHSYIVLGLHLERAARDQIDPLIELERLTNLNLDRCHRGLRR